MKKLEMILVALTVFLFACVVLGILTYVPEREIKSTFESILAVFQATLMVAIVSIGVILVLAAGGALLWFSWIGFFSALAFFSKARSRARVYNAVALKRERQATAEIIVAPPGSQVYGARLVTSPFEVVIEPLHLLQGAAEGAWKTFQTHQSINKASRLMAPVPEAPIQIAAPLPDHVDLGHYLHGETSLRNIFLGVGRFPDGQVRPVSAPLSRLVHIAVAGSSGFGKSYFQQSLAYQMCNAREGAQAVLLDAQGVTFTPFEDSSSLLFPLASEPDAIRLILGELVKIMSERKDLFSAWRGVDTLEKYNRIAEQKLPAIPILFDEFGLVADDKVIAGHVEKLSQGGRKFGLYMIAGAQTWYSDRIASSLKANLSTAVQFYARSKSQSRVLLNDAAAADITQPGRAFCRLPGQAGLIELQAPDVSNVIEVEPVRIERPVIDMEPEEDEDDMFVRLVAEGKSRDKASREAYRKDYAGTSHVNRCRRLLGEIE